MASPLVGARVRIASPALKSKDNQKEKMRTGSTNQNLRKLIEELKTLSIEKNSGIWKRIATDLERPARNRRIVNLSRINRYANENEVLVVPGKVLASGPLDRKVTVAASNFSLAAVEKIKDAGGNTMTISELMKKNPEGKNVRIIG